MCEKRLCGRGPGIHSFLQLEHKLPLSLGHLSCSRLLPLCMTFKEGPSQPVPTAACELLSVSVWTTFRTAVGDCLGQTPHSAQRVNICWGLPWCRFTHWTVQGEGTGLERKRWKPQCKMFTNTVWNYKEPPENLRSLASTFLFLCRKKILNLRGTRSERVILNTGWFSSLAAAHRHKKKKTHFHCRAPVITVNECFLSLDGWWSWLLGAFH